VNTPSEPSERIPQRASQLSAIVRGSLGFAGVSLAGFAVWAFAERWLYARVGEGGLYAACAIAFLGTSGLLLHPLISGPRAIARFYKVFIPAFIGYAAAWCGAWFVFHYGWGEWLGSLAGSVVFAAVAGRMLGSLNGFLKVAAVLFITHSAGYFLGGKLMHWLASPAGAEFLSGFSKHQLRTLAKLSWGVPYGLGFGAGIGYAFFTFQRSIGSKARPAPAPVTPPSPQS
jgi:hypothetical protein